MISLLLSIWGSKIIPDFFAHDLDAVPLPAVPPRFGLVDASPDRWTRFRAALADLNASARQGESYKAIICIRHGQGYHNVAETKYGTEAWDDYWSKLEGDEELVWGPDPELTPTGVAQARDVRRMWEQELASGLGLPSRIYSSPFERALRTGFVTFEGLMSRDEERKKWLIVENCREENGVHTCDKRLPRSAIAASYPNYPFDEGFSEEDELWDKDVRETKPQVGARAKTVLDRIFTDETGHVIAITAHSGFINGVLLALGRKPYALPTGGRFPSPESIMNELDGVDIE